MFCPDCGTWNRGAAKQCAKCNAALPDVRVASEAPDALITSLRQAMGNRYRIIRRLGAGGMADVYAAEHEQLGRPLAVKVMHAHLARDNEMRERFRREAEAASRLVHHSSARRLITERPERWCTSCCRIWAEAAWPTT